MLYAALTFWLLVIMFSAWGVHQLWSGLIKPRVVNGILLPGTLVAQLGHVLGLLVTGNPVQNTKLMDDDESGSPKSDTPDQQRIPVIGPIVIGLLPLLACGVCLYVASTFWGGSVLDGLSVSGVEATRPQTLNEVNVWGLLRGSITLVENMVNAILNSDVMNWRTLLFLYLAVCLTVRMAPFEGNRRGARGDPAGGGGDRGYRIIVDRGGRFRRLQLADPELRGRNAAVPAAAFTARGRRGGAGPDIGGQGIAVRHEKPRLPSVPAQRKYRL